MQITGDIVSYIEGTVRKGKSEGVMIWLSTGYDFMIE
jgi:hypothetical protein